MGNYRTFRQRFNLSSYAWDIIENDAAIFTNARKPSIAGMINLILELYKDDSEAAIEKSADRRRTVLRQQLADLLMMKQKTGSLKPLYIIISRNSLTK